jgi:hypothetical protein
MQVETNSRKILGYRNTKKISGFEIYKKKLKKKLIAKILEISFSILLGNMWEIMVLGC